MVWAQGLGCQWVKANFVLMSYSPLFLRRHKLILEGESISLSGIVLSGSPLIMPSNPLVGTHVLVNLKAHKDWDILVQSRDEKW